MASEGRRQVKKWCGEVRAPGSAAMTPWPARDPFDLQLLGKRLWVLLLVVAAYYVAAGLVVQWFRVRAIDLGRAGSLINTLILSLLMGFRNRAAYGRWWEARGLWGQLTNDTRNLAAKCAAFVPADVLARSRCRRDPGDLSRSLEAAPAECIVPVAGLAGVRARGGGPAARAAVPGAATVRRRRGLEARRPHRSGSALGPRCPRTRVARRLRRVREDPEHAAVAFLQGPAADRPGPRTC